MERSSIAYRALLRGTFYQKKRLICMRMRTCGLCLAWCERN